MTRRRVINDGLPHRVYEYWGTEVYSIGFKKKDNRWAFRLTCPIADKVAIARIRRDAIRRALSFTADGSEIETVNHLIADWLSWQQGLPVTSTRKRALSTMTENEREAQNLRDVFGEMAIVDIKAHHAYSYLDKCDALKRGPKGNKEISLFQLILQQAVRKGIIDSNPLRGVDKLPTSPSTRYVEDSELDLALRAGRARGGSTLLAALALHVTFLCVRRSTEGLDLRWADIHDDGIHWVGKKRTATDFKRKVVIAWSPELRSMIEEARAVRGKIDDQETEFVFGTQNGTRYTKGGWKKTLDRLMDACREAATAEGREFTRFNLQDQRAKGVSDKMEACHQDVQDATLHKSERMMHGVYDRRRTRRAKPAR
jgi:integrase